MAYKGQPIRTIFSCRPSTKPNDNFLNQIQSTSVMLFTKTLLGTGILATFVAAIPVPELMYGPLRNGIGKREPEIYQGPKHLLSEREPNIYGDNRHILAE